MHISKESLEYALRALRREVLEFRFEYPLYLDALAGPRGSLHYYLYSEQLEWSILRMDPTGVPMARTRLMGTFYKPAYLSWWGPIKLGHFLRHNDESSRDAFLRQVNWLESHAVMRSDGSVVWMNNYDCLHGDTLLRAPWISAYDQGLAISALVRGYRLTKRPHLLELLRGASQIFSLPVCEGGVKVPLSDGCLYSELPGEKVPGIQDGFMTALLALYDLFVETGDPIVKTLFDEGVAGLKAMLPTWDYRERWSWYGSRAYLCPPQYHCLNRLLLETLNRLTGDILLAAYADKWNMENLSGAARAEIYLMFLFSKNLCRLRNRTWQLTPAKIQGLASQQGSRKIPGRDVPATNSVPVPQYSTRRA